MYTRFKLFKESLSKERSTINNEKILLEKIKTLIETNIRLEAIELEKKTKTETLKELLNKLETHSIICNGVLLELIGDYESSRTNLKEYHEFIATSRDILEKQYIEMYDKIKETETIITQESSQIRINKNKKKLPDGVVESRIWDSIKQTIRSLKYWSMSFFKNATNEIQTIKDKLQNFNTIENNLTVESIKIKSKYQKQIINTLRKSLKKMTVLSLCKANGDVNPNTLYGISIQLKALMNKGIIERTKIGKLFYYDLIDYNMDFDETTLIDIPTTGQTVSNELIIETLENARELIATSEEEKYYTELQSIQREEIQSMMKKMNITKFAVDDKIVQLINISSKDKLNEADFLNKMSDANIVGDSIAEMSQSLFSLYTKTHNVSGSLRQYKDDTNSPDGTLDATFDWVLKKVELPTTESNSIINRTINLIKRFISNFKIAFNRVTNALNRI